MKQKTINMKKEKRNVVMSIILKAFGLSFCLLGIIIIIISIPLILMVVGIFSGLVGFAIVVLGTTCFSFSKYNSENVNCPYCNDEKILNFNLCKRGSYKCRRCKNVVLVK